MFLETYDVLVKGSCFSHFPFQVDSIQNVSQHPVTEPDFVLL